MKMRGLSYRDRMKYRFYIFGIAKWAKFHSYLAAAHKLVFRINKRTRIKLFKNITFSLGTKIFELCNFCFEMRYLFLAKADHIAKRKAIHLERY
ncbi:hypothetical protein AN697_20920 [Enterobacter cloacae subsp. cloacae]|nr:hypothetical protein AN697_20920 [Enterobacter cloacae subsp. cloacae]